MDRFPLSVVLIALNPVFSVAPIESPRYDGPSLWGTTIVQSVTILDDGSNLSDHLPVTMVCDLSSRGAAFLGRQDDPVSVSGKACHFNVPESTNN